MSSSSPSPTSDETPSERERQRLRNFVNEVTAIDRQASMSPRSAVLSHSSLHTRPHSTQPVDPTSAVVDPRSHHRKRSKRRHHHQHRPHTPAGSSQALELARPSALSQLVDIDISRKNPIDEVMRLRQILKTVEKHAVLETQRATELQRANQEAQLQVQLLNETKLVAEQEALKAQQEKRLYQLQLDSAQKEIERSQEAVKRAERQKEDAEAEVARARAKARKLHEQQLMMAAREEGRRIGFEAGFEHARAERQAARASRKRSSPPKAEKPELKPVPIEYNTSNRSRSRVDKGKGKERAIADEEEEITPYRSNLQYTEYPPARQSTRERDDIISSPEGPDMSPSALKIKNLPAFDSRPPSMRAGPSNTTPLRAFKPPPATHSEASRRDAPPANFQPFPQSHVPPPPPPIEIVQPIPQPAQQQSPHPSAHAPIRGPTPEMRVWSVDVPTQSQLNVSSMPVPGTHLPRDQWVSAEKRFKTPSPPPQFPDGPPRIHIPPPPQSQPKPTTSKTARFPLLSRPSLKQQATSWYRSLSLRKKSRPVIDPEEPPTTASTSAPPNSAPLNSASTVDSQPPTATADSAGLYGRQQSQPVMSWYQAKQPSVPAPPTVRSQYSKHRPTSDMMSVSTRVSQFDLLSTPYIASQSVKSGKEGARRVKEKESYMSVIKENPFSRENTPNADRYLAAGDIPGGPGPGGENGPFVTQPNFGQQSQPQPSLNQRTSYATLESSNKRNSRRPPPPGISVPDPDDVLEPAGAAYARHLRSTSGGGGEYLGADLSRRPSRASEKTVPNTSIEIDIVPPSGFAPDIPNSPPHTGINHLSPYRTYGTTASQHQASPRVAAMQSVTSLRTQGGTRIEPLAVDRDRRGSVSGSRSKSRQSLNTYTLHDPAPLSYPSRPPSTTSRAPSRANNEHRYQENTQSYARSSGRPESVRSSASRPAQPHPINTQTQDTSINATPGQGQYLDRPNIQRMKSSTSLRSVGSYSKYKPEEYVDPAFWSANGPGELMHHPSIVGGSIYGQERPASRAASVNSGLSYA